MLNTVNVKEKVTKIPNEKNQSKENYIRYTKVDPLWTGELNIIKCEIKRENYKEKRENSLEDPGENLDVYGKVDEADDQTKIFRNIEKKIVR